MQKKQVIKERVLAWEDENADVDTRTIIESLGREQICAKPGKAVLPIMKEFYANLQGMVNDKVFVRGQWVDISISVPNKLLSSPDDDEDEYIRLMEEGVETNQLE